MPQTKNSEAYLRYTTFESIQIDIAHLLASHETIFKFNFYIYTPLYSRKLHIFVRRARTSCVTSFTILALTFGAIVVNHFARRTLPDDQDYVT